MHRDGHIVLPPPTKPANNHLKKPKPTLFTNPRPEVVKNAGEYALTIEVAERTTSALWNEYIDRYHYLGYTPLPGAQMRYFVKSEDEVLALLGFGAAAWKCAPRDESIGWDSPTEKKEPPPCRQQRPVPRTSLGKVEESGIPDTLETSVAPYGPPSYSFSFC